MNYTKIIDISWPISPEMTAYKDKNIVFFNRTKTFDHDHVREALVTIGTHSGTHIDAPAHFLATGATIDQQPLAPLVGLCRVLDLTHCIEKITTQDLVLHDIKPGERILCKTRNSDVEPTACFNPAFVFIDKTASEYLASCKILAVGIDYLGVERGQPNHETHIVLLGAGIAVIEGLRLAAVQPGAYDLICLPLLMNGLDGAPARAILLQR